MAARCLLPLSLVTSLADVPDYQTKAEGLQHWRAALQKGRLPRNSNIEFPVEPFKSKFLVQPSLLRPRQLHTQTSPPLHTRRTPCSRRQRLPSCRSLPNPSTRLPLSHRHCSTAHARLLMLHTHQVVGQLVQMLALCRSHSAMAERCMLPMSRCTYMLPINPSRHMLAALVEHLSLASRIEACAALSTHPSLNTTVLTPPL